MLNTARSLKVREMVDSAAIAADLVVGKAAQLLRDTAVISAKDAE